MTESSRTRRWPIGPADRRCFRPQARTAGSEPVRVAALTIADASDAGKLFTARLPTAVRPLAPWPNLARHVGWLPNQRMPIRSWNADEWLPSAAVDCMTTVDAPACRVLRRPGLGPPSSDFLLNLIKPPPAASLALRRSGAVAPGPPLPMSRWNRRNYDD